MPVRQQDETTFRKRIRGIERRNPRRYRRPGRSPLARLPLNTLVVAAALLLAVKVLVLNSVPEGEYRQAALTLSEEGPVGQVLATIFGPDPVSLELARRINF